MAAFSSPSGSPPPSGLMISQKRLWLAWPPALLRTAARISSGIAASAARTDSTLEFSHSVPASALFALST